MSRVVMPETETTTTHKPAFDLHLASKCAPDMNWPMVTSDFSLDSQKLRPYVVEDLMFADPDVHECLLLFISTKHPVFVSGMWINIWNEQDVKRAPITVSRETCFQTETEVVRVFHFPPILI
jgi:hypothetical protein